MDYAIEWDLREECIKNTLTSEQWVIGSMLLRNGSRGTDGPNLHHGMLRNFAIEFSLQNDVLRIYIRYLAKYIG